MFKQRTISKDKGASERIILTKRNRENIETQLNVIVTKGIASNMAKKLRKKKYRNPEWTMENTMNYLKEKNENRRRF